MSQSIDGLASGLNTTQIIAQLMAVERQPQDSLKASQTKINTKIGYYSQLNTYIKGIDSAAKTLNISSYWKLTSGQSSDEDIATVSTQNGALAGSLTFKVAQVAQANIKSSLGSVTSLDATAGNSDFLIGLGGKVGIGTMEASAGWDNGKHTFEVTQASTGASQSGSALGDSVTVANGDTIVVDISGQAQTINLTAGTYSRRELADMITTASGGTISASVNGSKALVLTSAREGSAASLTITGGVNLGTVGLSAGSANYGTDGIIEVDGVASTVTDIDPNSTIRTSLNAANSDTVDVTFSGGLRVGSFNAYNVAVGDGKLSTIVDNINSTGSGVTATAVKVADGQYKLQLSSSTQGTDGNIAVDSRGFNGFLGDVEDLVEAQNAKMVIGSGANAYNLYSSSNTITSVLPSVTINLHAPSTDPVTITVSRDSQAVSDKVKALIDAANTALAYINTNTSYDASTKTAGAMLGDSTFERMRDKIISSIGEAVSASSYGAAGSIGISLGEDGTFNFDESTFKTKYAADPENTVKVFLQGGTTGAGVGGNSPGIVDRLIDFSFQATRAGTGAITSVIAGQQTEVDRLSKAIDEWDTRLTAKETSLRLMYANLETALANLSSIQSQLSSQLAQLG